MTDLERLAAGNRDKARRAIDRVTASLVASLADSQAFDPRINYTPKPPNPTTPWRTALSAPSNAACVISAAERAG